MKNLRISKYSEFLHSSEESRNLRSLESKSYISYILLYSRISNDRRVLLYRLLFSSTILVFPPAITALWKGEKDLNSMQNQIKWRNWIRPRLARSWPWPASPFTWIVSSVLLSRAFTHTPRHRNPWTNSYVQQRKLLRHCCKIRESVYVVRLRRIHQWDSRCLQQLQRSFFCWTQPLEQKSMHQYVSPIVIRNYPCAHSSWDSTHSASKNTERKSKI